MNCSRLWIDHLTETSKVSCVSSSIWILTETSFPVGVAGSFCPWSKVLIPALSWTPNRGPAVDLCSTSPMFGEISLYIWQRERGGKKESMLLYYVKLIQDIKVNRNWIMCTILKLCKSFLSSEGCTQRVCLWHWVFKKSIWSILFFWTVLATYEVLQKSAKVISDNENNSISLFRLFY